MFLNEKQIVESISKLFSNSKKVDCAVAFIGKGALEIIPKNCEVRIICNLESGATNPNAIKELIERGVIIKSHPDLHAKVYIGDDYSVVGSANLSANGLGLEGSELSGWIEAGFKEKDQESLRSIRQWWKLLWTASNIITVEYLEKYLKKWEERRKIRPTSRLVDQSLLDALIKNPESVTDRNIYVVIYKENFLSDEAQKTLNSIQDKRKYGVNVEAYEGWDQLPEDAYLLDFHVGPRGGVTYQGIYKSPKKKIIVAFPDSSGEKETLFLCYKETDINGYRIKSNDSNRMKSAIRKILGSKIGIGDADAKFLPIMEAKPYFAES